MRFAAKNDKRFAGIDFTFVNILSGKIKRKEHVTFSFRPLLFNVNFLESLYLMFNIDVSLYDSAIEDAKIY